MCFEMGDRTAIPPYDYENMRVVAHDMPPIVRASMVSRRLGTAEHLRP